jgi:hypothetical protein
VDGLTIREQEDLERLAGAPADDALPDARPAMLTGGDSADEAPPGDDEVRPEDQPGPA